MKPTGNHNRFGSKRVLLLVWIGVTLLAQVAHAQESAPKKVLVLYWQQRDLPWNVAFEEGFRPALESAPGGSVEYYAEYLESNRFPGESQAVVFHDYLRQKYADQAIDVVVANSDATLEFLMKYREDLFQKAPIVFAVARQPARELTARNGITGIININNHRKTLDLALRLQPATEQVYVVSGTVQRDKRLETLARDQLQTYENRVRITYLTDLQPEELLTRMKEMPERSIVLYVWQQTPTEQGKVLDSPDILGLIAPAATVPIYKSSAPLYAGGGVVGGYVNQPRDNGSRVAEIVLELLSGTRAADIPVESAPSALEFDWRELRRWSIRESDLPAGSIVRFKELSFWQLNKARIAAAVILFTLQASLIAVLLLARRRRRHAAGELRESESHYRDLLEKANDIIYTHDLSGRFTSLNRTGETISGYTRDEARRMNVAQVVVPEHLELVRGMIDSRIPGEDNASFELEIIAKDGRRVALDVRTRLIYDGKRPIGVQGIARDISERKRAAAALVEWRNRYEAAVQSSNQILYDWDPKTNDVSYGGDLERILGFTPAELNGGIDHWIELVHPDDRAAFNQEIERVLATGDSYHLTYRVCRKDGTVIWLEDHGHFFRDENGQIVRMVGLLDDLTERRRAAELIRKVNVELEQRVAGRTAELAAKTRELEAFTYSVAHDLKAPLRGIDGYSRLLLEDYLDKLDDEGQSFRERICESANQMKQLIDDLLAYSHIERRDMASNRIDLVPFIEGLIKERTADIAARGIELSVNVNGEAALGDSSALAQAMRNYIDNAIKFTRDTANPRIEVGACESENGCRLWVRDNGIGFDIKYQDRIFEIFNRLHHSEDYAGTGIGLAIVRKAMERMGGRVWAESQVGEGATFYIEIPPFTANNQVLTKAN